jgi:hypothetical protein
MDPWFATGVREAVGEPGALPRLRGRKGLPPLGTLFRFIIRFAMGDECEACHNGGDPFGLVSEAARQDLRPRQLHLPNKLLHKIRAQAVFAIMLPAHRDLGENIFVSGLFTPRIDVDHATGNME